MRSIFFINILMLCLFSSKQLFSEVYLGVDQLFFEKSYTELLCGKKIGLITNQSAINHAYKKTHELFCAYGGDYQLVALFAPEHGFYGDAHASERIEDEKHGEIPIYSLHGKHRRPTKEMLKGIDLLVYDIQDIGSRSYTFISTLFFCMEEAAKHGIPLIVLDRPNPMGGCVVDGPLVDPERRSFVGYANIPYCHGMTVGELAHLFNGEYRVKCELTVVPMKGWKRGMAFQETHLPWVPTSPQIPEASSPFFYPTTGVIGHCSIVNIGVGYTLPFKLIGAPWIDAAKLADALNGQHLPGVHFEPFFYRPFFGKFKLESCRGVRILVTDHTVYLPITTQYTIMGMLKNHYPHQFDDAMRRVLNSKNKREMFHLLNGREEILNIVTGEKFIIWKLREICQRDRAIFMPVRKKYLIPAYS